MSAVQPTGERLVPRKKRKVLPPESAENATGFEEYGRACDQFYGDRVVSVRRIPPNRRSVTGLVPSAKNSRAIAFESTLERDFVTLLEFDTAILRYEEQPLELRFRGPDGRWRIGYPDFLVQLQPWLEAPPMLCDVKYRREIFERWAELKPRLKAAYQYARERGWTYRIKTEVEIRGPRLNNAKFLLPYGRCEPNSAHELRLVDKLRKMGEATPSSLLIACCGETWERAELIPTLWCLVARKISIGCDLDLPLTMSSEIWPLGA